MQTITTKVSYIWSQKQSRYILLNRRLSIIRTTGWALCKGASTQQTQEANSGQQFAQIVQQDFSQYFAGQANILSSLNNTLSPIIAAGPNQFGFSQGETNTLNSQAIQGTGQQYNNASRALAANQAAQGGGNIALPSGANAAQQAGLAAAEANQASSQLLGIQEQGYATGRQNFNNAVGQEGAVAGMYNPSSIAGQANTAGSNAFSAATTVQKMNNEAQNQLWSTIGGIAGGIGGAILGMPGIGAKLGSGIGSLASGGDSGGGGGDDWQD